MYRKEITFTLAGFYCAKTLPVELPNNLESCFVQGLFLENQRNILEKRNVLPHGNKQILAEHPVLCECPALVESAERHFQSLYTLLFLTGRSLKEMANPPLCLGESH